MREKYGNDAAFSLAQSLTFKWISDYGKVQNKPVVLSWSENGHHGFHDGTSASAQAIRNFCKEGNIAIICASNEGGDSLHVHKKLGAGETLKLMINSTKRGAKSFSYFPTTKNAIANPNTTAMVFIIIFFIEYPPQKKAQLQQYAAEPS